MAKSAIEKRKDYADRAAEAYQHFRRRTQNILVLTTEEKVERLTTFLDAHVDIFSEYYEEAERVRAQKRRELKKSELLSHDAEEMSKDIAAILPRSAVGQYHMRHTGNLTASQQAAFLDTEADRLTGRDLSKGQANQSHLSLVDTKFETMKRRSSLDFGAAPAAAPAPDRSYSPAGVFNARLAPLEAAAAAADTRLQNLYSQVQQTQRELEAEELRLKSRDSSAAAPGPDRTKELRIARDASLRNAVLAQETATQAKLLRDRKRQERENDPTLWRRHSTTDRTDGLSSEQIRGIRNNSAFLFRNTRYGGDTYSDNSGFFVDGILRRPPRQQLLIYYLIEKKKFLQSKISDAELTESILYTPKLEAFKEQMLGSFRGVFGRLHGKSLKWEILSDAAQNSDHLIKRVDSIIEKARNPVAGAAGGGAVPAAVAAGGAGPAPAAGGAAPGPAAAAGGDNGIVLDQELQDLLLSVVMKGRELLADPTPSKDAVDDFVETVQLMNERLPVIHKRMEKLGEFKTNVNEFNTWLGYVTTPLSLVSGVLSEAFERSTSIQSVMGGFSWELVPLSSISAFASILTVIHSVASAANAAQDGSPRAAAQAVKDTVGFLKNTWSSIRGFGKLLGGEAWAGSELASMFGGALSVTFGIMSASQGLVNNIIAGDEERRAAAFQRQVSDLPRNPILTAEQQEALDAQVDLLDGIAEESRVAAHRRKIASRVQIATGAMQVASGSLAFFSGGTLSFISAGISGLAFVVGLSGTIYSYVKKNKERISVIDRFIGLQDYYDKYVEDRSQQEGITQDKFISNHGGEEKLKEPLRNFAMRSLGFISEEKLFSFIMWQYAKALYKGAFLKNDGTVLTAEEESDTQHNTEREDRKLYVDLLKTYELDFAYPESRPGFKPVKQSPSVNEIYKKLLS